MKYSFTQPACASCFSKAYGTKEPTRMKNPEREVCCMCGRGTHSGIYIRVDPKHVPHPSLTK